MPARGKGADEDVLDLDLPHRPADRVIMNPPFAGPTNHESAEVPVQSFAGIKTGEAEQGAMSQRLWELRQHCEAPTEHGNAGIASNFIDVAHASRFDSDVTVVSMAATGAPERALSAHAGMWGVAGHRDAPRRGRRGAHSDIARQSGASAAARSLRNGPGDRAHDAGGARRSGAASGRGRTFAQSPAGAARASRSRASR